jgi:GTP-binding protein YchF
MSKSAKIVPASCRFTDIAGLVRGSSTGEGLGNQFLGHLREVDALCYVLRAFEDDNVAHPEGRVDALDDLATLETELCLADLQSAERGIERLRKQAKSGDKTANAAIAAHEQAVELLSDGIPLYHRPDAERSVGLASSFLLTDKPVLYVLNIGEDQLGQDEPEASLRAVVGAEAEVVSVSVQLEAEAAELDESERAEMLEQLGLGEGALARLIRAAYHKLGLRTFLTTGPMETRAWTIRAGATAVDAAGVIHSDLAHGFIRAEVIPADELLSIGSWNGAKDVGRIRLEGKAYVVEDGDVLVIRHNA